MRFLFVEAVPAANMTWPRNVGTDALRAAQRLGLTSIVATANRGAYGATLDGLVDSWQECDTTSAAAVADAAHAARADVVYSWIDAFVPVASAVATSLGAPAANPGSQAVLRDKSAVRRQLDASGVRNARWAVIDLREGVADSPIGYPAVIKPVDGTGGKDVLLVTDRASFRAACAAHLNRAGYGHQVIPAYRMVCEELLAGELVSVEGIVIDGAADIWGYTDRGHTGPPAYVETSFAFAAAPFHPALEEYAKQVAKALDYRTGCFHLEAIITQDGPVLVEFNSRIASGIYRCVDIATGGSCLEAMLLAQLGERQTLPAAAGAACRIYLEATASGRLRGVAGVDAARAMPGVADVLVKTSATLAPGDADRRVAYVQSAGVSREQARELAGAAIAALTPELALPDRVDDRLGALGGGRRRDVDEPVTEFAVAVAVQLLERDGLIEGHPACRRLLAEPEVAHEEDRGLVDLLTGDPAQLAAQQRRRFPLKQNAQRVRADRRAVVELHANPRVSRVSLTAPLQRDDLVDEILVQPRLGPAARLLLRDDIGRGLRDGRVAQFGQVPEDGGLPRTGSAGQDVALHHLRRVPCRAAP